MDSSLLALIKNLVSILPTDWSKVTFSTFIRECVVNDKKTYSKEFKCYCLSDSCDVPINIVKVYEDNFEVEDLFFDFLDYFYKNQFNGKDGYNFITFKLDLEGNYEINKLSLENDISNSDIVSIISEYIKKNI